jgi:hypothetical protein
MEQREPAEGEMMAWKDGRNTTPAMREMCLSGGGGILRDFVHIVPLEMKVKDFACNGGTGARCDRIRL